MATSRATSVVGLEAVMPSTITRPSSMAFWAAARDGASLRRASSVSRRARVVNVAVEFVLQRLVQLLEKPRPFLIRCSLGRIKVGGNRLEGCGCVAGTRCHRIIFLPAHCVVVVLAVDFFLVVFFVDFLARAGMLFSRRFTRR